MGRFDSIKPDGVEEDIQASEDLKDPYDADHFLKLANDAMARGNFEGALKLYGRALQRDPNRLEGWMGQVRALIDMGQPQEAMTWLEQAAGVLGEVPPLLGMRAIAAARCGNREDALAWSDRAMREGQDHMEVWLSRAEVLYLNQQPKIAIKALEKAVERAPGPTSERQVGEIALEYGDTGQAAIWLERAWRHAPEDPMVALRLGVLRDRQGDPERARSEFQRAISLAPDLQAARLALDEIDGRDWWTQTRAKLKKWMKS